MKKFKVRKLIVGVISSMIMMFSCVGVSMAELADGTYKVPVHLKKAVEDADSMGAKAMEAEAIVKVTSGKPEVTLYFKGLDFMNMHGHIEKLYTYSEGTDLTSTSKVPEEAKISETYEDSGLDGNQKTFPRAFVFERENTNETFIPVRVLVDAMASIASDGKGEQDARVMIDYNAAKKTDDTSVKDTTEDKKDEKKEEKKTDTTSAKANNTNSPSSTSKPKTTNSSSSGTVKAPETLPKTGSTATTKKAVSISLAVIVLGIIIKKKSN